MTKQWIVLFMNLGAGVIQLIVSILTGASIKKELKFDILVCNLLGYLLMISYRIIIVFNTIFPLMTF